MIAKVRPKKAKKERRALHDRVLVLESQVASLSDALTRLLRILATTPPGEPSRAEEVTNKR